MPVRRSIERPVGIETRNDGTRYLRGYAAVYYEPGNPGTQFELSENLVERFEPGAFADVADNPDLVATFNHNIDAPLGRVPETLTVRADETGLFYELDLPPTQQGNDLAIQVERNVIRGSSITMKAEASYQTEGNVTVRSISKADVLELGPVLNPAYRATSAEMRSIEAEIAEFTGEAERERIREKVASSLAKLDK